jgi:transposase-like protein
MANPIWASVAAATAQKLSKRCPHCDRAALYPQKRPGQFYTCKQCGHRFKERGEAARKDCGR